MKKIFVGLLLLILCACSTSEIDKEIETISISGKIVLTDDNGNVDIDITNTDFLNSGFNYGDSVNVKLENGYELEDIPFLSGMYVEYGKTMVYGKASKDKVSFIQKYKSFVENSKASKEMDYIITLNEAGKYSYIENVGNLICTNNFEDYNDEIKFSNFREVTVGDIKQGRLYRSASPIDNSTNRSGFVTNLALKHNIKTILNIIDKEDAYNELLLEIDDNTKTLIDNVNVILAPISNDYQAEKNIKNIVNGLNQLINNEYPYLIHCLEGKDRVGYELAIIEALCNASYEQIVDDYMTTYYNFYNITKDSDLEKYNYIKQTNIDAMLKFITGSDDLNNVDYRKATTKFLTNYGMSEDNINQLINKLCQ